MDPGSDPSCQAFVEIDTAKASSQGCDCTTTTKAACEVAISCTCTDKQRISTAKYTLDLLVQGTTISGGGTVVNGAGTTCAYSNVTGNVD